MVLEDGLKIFLCSSKTDKLGIEEWVHLMRCHQGNICPVTAFHAYMVVRPVVSDRLFVHVNGARLTVYQFSAVLKKCLAYLKLDHLKITTHSFRIGATTEAVRIGLEESTINKIGRWQSDSFKLYIRP